MCGPQEGDTSTYMVYTDYMIAADAMVQNLHFLENYGTHDD